MLYILRCRPLLKTPPATKTESNPPYVENDLDLFPLLNIDMDETTSTIPTTAPVATVAEAVIALTVIRGPFFKDGKHFFYLATDAERKVDITTGELVDNTFSIYMSDDANHTEFNKVKAYLEQNGQVIYKRKQ